MKFRQLLRILPFALLLMLSVTIVPMVFAQNNCPTLVQQALGAMGDNCGNMERNTACYGYNLVGATFASEVAEDFFTQPSDRAQINEIETLSTAALSVSDDRWGVAVMTLQANIPNTLPGQAVTFVLLGDVEVENAVPADSAASPAEPIPVSARQIANIRSAPSTNANVVGAVTVGEQILADGLNAGGDWLRVTTNHSLVGWIFRDLVESTADLSVLPPLTSETRAPMQAFYLRTGIGQPACEEAPADALVVQGPQRVTVDLTVNGANVSLGSTAVFKIVEGDRLEIAVLEGTAIVEGVRVPQGYKTTLCLSEPENRGSDGEANDQVVNCAPSTPRFLGENEQKSWCALGEIPDSLLSYTIPITCSDGILFPTVSPTQPPTKNFGDPDPSGQLPDEDVPQIDAACGGLRPTSPLTDAPSSPTTFYWDGIAAATDYNLIFYDVSGAVTRTQFASGNSTNAPVSGLVEGTQFQWAVEAYAGDVLLCTSLPTGLISVLGPQGDTPLPTFELTASWACGPVSNEITLTWGGIPETDDVELVWDDDYPFGGPYTNTFGPGPGSATFTFFMPGVFTGHVDWPAEDQRVNLPAITCP